MMYSLTSIMYPLGSWLCLMYDLGPQETLGCRRRGKKTRAMIQGTCIC